MWLGLGSWFEAANTVNCSISAFAEAANTVNNSICALPEPANTVNSDISALSEAANYVNSSNCSCPEVANTVTSSISEFAEAVNTAQIAAFLHFSKVAKTVNSSKCKPPVAHLQTRCSHDGLKTSMAYNRFCKHCTRIMCLKKTVRLKMGGSLKPSGGVGGGAAPPICKHIMLA